MGYPTKIQLIKRKTSEQWYINFPSAVAHAMEFDRGEIVEWVIEDKEHLILKRRLPAQQAKKKRTADSSESLRNSSEEGERPSAKKGPS